jgi:hypothetical protein
MPPAVVVAPARMVKRLWVTLALLSGKSWNVAELGCLVIAWYQGSFCSWMLIIW